MENVKKYNEWYKINEEGDGGGSCGSGDGGGTAFAGLGQNGMGNIVSPQTGTIAGSLWQGGSGTIGSGDKVAYDMGDHFGWKGDKYDKKKGRKGKKDKKPIVMTKFSEWIGPSKNEKVYFFDKNERWFSTSNSLSDVKKT